MVRKGGLEPPPLAGPDPKSGASASSATFAVELALLLYNHLASGHGAVDSGSCRPRVHRRTVMEKRALAQSRKGRSGLKKEVTIGTINLNPGHAA